MTVYYVATAGDGGSDSNNGLSVGAPFLTIAHGLTFLAAGGDTLFIRRGTYAEKINDGIASGSVGNVVLISGYQSEIPVIQPAASAAVGIFLDNASYVTFANLILDGTNANGATAPDGVKITYQTGASAPFAHNITFNGCTIQNWQGNGFLNTQDTTTNNGLTGNNSIINCTVNNNGLKFGHGFYFEASDNLVQGCTISNNGEHGVQIYSQEPGVSAGDTVNSSRNTVTQNKIYGNGFGLHSDSLPSNCGGVYVNVGNANVVMNNIIYANNFDENSHPGQSGGIIVQGGGAGVKATGTLIYNNTVADHVGTSTTNGAGINLQDGSGAIVKNNISYANKGSTSIEHDYVNLAGTTTSDYNLTGDASATGAHSLTNTNPLFFDASLNNFHLQSGSAARNAGVSTSPTVTVDYDGVSRPRESAYCIGAFEFVTSGGGKAGDDGGMMTFARRSW